MYNWMISKLRLACFPNNKGSPCEKTTETMDVPWVASSKLPHLEMARVQSCPRETTMENPEILMLGGCSGFSVVSSSRICLFSKSS